MSVVNDEGKKDGNIINWYSDFSLSLKFNAACLTPNVVNYAEIVAQDLTLLWFSVSSLISTFIQ